MEYDREKVDEMVLALLALTMFPEGPGVRAWKYHDWDANGTAARAWLHLRPAE